MPEPQKNRPGQHRRHFSDLCGMMQEKRIVIVLPALAGYVAVFLLLYVLTGRGIGALAILPVIAIGWSLGMWGGALAGVLSFPLNVLLMHQLGEKALQRLTSEGGGVVGTLALILIGAVVGRLSELSSRIKRELAERKRAEESLRETSQKLLALIEASPLAIVVINTGREVTMWNPAAERMFGWRETAAPARPLPPAFTEDNTDCQRLMETVFRGTAVMAEELHLQLKGGACIDISFSSAPLFNRYGTVTAIMALIADVTEQNRMQKEIIVVSGREQRRIGQDLHDGLGQVLTGVAFMGRALEQKLALQGRPEAASAGEITRLVNEAITQTHSLARGLYPVTLQSDGLEAALEEFAAGTETLFGICCTFTSDRSARLDDSASAIHLYRIVQEAVNNAIRHGKAAHVSISLASHNGRRVLSITDDGAGMESPPLPGKGMGITLMNYRARMVGAALDVRSLPGSGTTVTCTFQNHNHLPAEGEPPDDTAG